MGYIVMLGRGTQLTLMVLGIGNYFGLYDVRFGMVASGDFTIGFGIVGGAGLVFMRGIQHVTMFYAGLYMKMGFIFG